MDRPLAFLLGYLVVEAAFHYTLAEMTVAAIVSAAASTVSAGSTLTGTTLSNLMKNDYRVNCGIEVENWTRFILAYPVVKIAAGALSIPPGNILPSKREAMVARKTSDSATGTSGTVSWLIEGQSRRIVVMWSAPYDFNFYSNWLGVGITSRGETFNAQGNSWFYQMYYGSNSRSLGFSRSEYYWESNPVIYQDDLIQLSATMSTGHQAQVKMTVRPINASDLATPIKAILKY
ncbi:hypothetical protein CHS0354_022498 [Potamilus streckersoni]|uniref:Conoporin n=1 Tax=Potamilus streckersoni TaxID=2493646 RepID=A0AAE0SXW1_9BIVA|nr:hypothetical protein CHS0354_022498 [Potamilus streckersoni]